MALSNCTQCGNPIMSGAKRCAHCDARTSPGGFHQAIGFCMGLAFLGVYVAWTNGVPSLGLHYTAGAGTETDDGAAAMRGGGWGGRSSLSCPISIFCVRLDALLELMKDRAQLQIVLHGPEDGFDFDKLDVNFQ